MRTTLLLLSVAGTALVATSAAAQAVIDPGMTKAQVMAKLGKPAVERTADGATYLFYRNGTERRVGMNDIVILDGDKVVDAVLRSSARRYSGTSSSPAAIPPEVARRAKATPPTALNMPAAPPAKPAGPAAPAASASGKLLPAAQAQQGDRARAMPQARSAILDQQKKDADAKDAAAKKPDEKLPDPKAPAPAAAAPTKKP